MATTKIVEAYIPAAALLLARRTAVLKEKSTKALAKFDASIASKIDPPGKVEAAITILKVKTRVTIAAEPYIEPPTPAHNAEEDSTDMKSFLEWASTAEVSRSSSGASTPDRSSTPASSAEQIEVAIVKSGPSVWSERQSKLGTRDGSDTMNKGITFARNVEGVKVLNVVEDSVIIPDPDWKKVRVGASRRRYGTRFMLVNSARKIQVMVETLVDSAKGRLVSIFIDLEGEDLGAQAGTADVLTIFHIPTNFSFLVPLAALGGTTFDIKHSSSSWTLRHVLEDHTILKGIWDVRNDSAGLLHDHGIYLGNNPRRLGLAAAIEACCEMSDAENACFRATKIRGEAMWCPEEGDSFEVFRAQLFAYIIQAYSVGDVALLSELLEELTKHLTWEDMKKIRGKSSNACEKSWDEAYSSGFDYSKVRNPWYQKGAQRAERLRQERETLEVSGEVEFKGVGEADW